MEGEGRKKKWQQISRWKTAQQWSRRRCRWSRGQKKGKGSTRCSETDKGQYVTKPPLNTRLRPCGKNVKSSERENRYRENKEETNCEEWMWRCSPVPLWLGLTVAGGWQARSVHGGKSREPRFYSGTRFCFKSFYLTKQTVLQWISFLSHSQRLKLVNVYLWMNKCPVNQVGRSETSWHSLCFLSQPDVPKHPVKIRLIGLLSSTALHGCLVKSESLCHPALVLFRGFRSLSALHFNILRRIINPAPSPSINTLNYWYFFLPHVWSSSCSMVAMRQLVPLGSNPPPPNLKQSKPLFSLLSAHFCVEMQC